MNQLLPSALLITAIALAGCSGWSSGGPVPSSVDPDVPRIAAKGLTFSTSILLAPADEPFQIVFDNQEAAPHNVAIYRDLAATDDVFVPSPFSGPAAVLYDVPALDPGTYFFRCDLHPEMAGQLTVS